MSVLRASTNCIIGLWLSVLNAQELKYTIEPVEEGGSHLLAVEVEAPADTGASTAFYFQDNQFGQPNQFMHIRLETEASWLPDSNRLVVPNTGASTVRLKYAVQDLQKPDQPFYEYCCYQPIIKPNYFHVQIGQLLLYPEHFWPDANARRRVVVEWKNLPKAYLLHSSLGKDSLQGGMLTNAEMQYGVFLGGDFRRHQIMVENQPVYYVTRGNWLLSEDSILHVLKKTFHGHRDFWHDHTDTSYLVSFLPIDDAPWTAEYRMYSLGGSCLTNSFMAYATNHAGLDLRAVKYLFVHELLHRWIGMEIENAAEEREYWFSEGFTDYYTYKSLLKFGLISLDEWLDEINKSVFFAHYTSPLKARPNSDLNYERFWNGGQDWEKLPYRRGCLFAFYLDLELKRSTGGKHNLDDVMRELLSRCRADRSLKLDAALVVSVLKPYLGARAEKLVKKHIEDGVPIIWTDRILPKGIKVQHMSGTVSSGPNRQTINKVFAYRNAPKLYRAKNSNAELIREMLIK